MATGGGSGRRNLNITEIGSAWLWLLMMSNMASKRNLDSINKTNARAGSTPAPLTKHLDIDNELTLTVL